MKVNPTLTDVLNSFKEEIFESLNCHAIAEVTKVNREDDTVNLAMVYKKRLIFVDQNGKTSNNLKSYPLMVDCPIISLSGGKSGLYMPVEIGDKALVFFNDRDIDNFISGDTKGYPETRRKHSFTDAIALVGLKNDVSKISDTDLKDDAVLFNDECVVAVGDKVKIANKAQNLFEVLNDLIDEISQITVTGAGPGNPTTTPINSPQFQEIKLKLSELMK